MSPSLWIGFILVALVLAAGGVEIFSERRRRGELRARYKLEFSSPLRDRERAARAEAALTARQRRLERAPLSGLGQPAPVAVPVIAHADARGAHRAVAADHAVSLEAD